MRKDFDEKRTVDVTVSRTVCDICGNTAVDKSAVISISARREEAHDRGGLYVQGNPYAPSLDICSVECLTKNINGITLVLNTKIIPSIDSNNKIDIGQSYSTSAGSILSVSNASTGLVWKNSSASNQAITSTMTSQTI